MISTFGPDELHEVYSAFDTAWASVENSTTLSNRKAVREHIGRGIIGLASAGHRNAAHLANYGAYQGRSYLDLRSGAQKTL